MKTIKAEHKNMKKSNELRWKHENMLWNTKSWREQFIFIWWRSSSHHCSSERNKKWIQALKGTMYVGIRRSLSNRSSPKLSPDCQRNLQRQSRFRLAGVRAPPVWTDQHSPTLGWALIEFITFIRYSGWSLIIYPYAINRCNKKINRCNKELESHGLENNISNAYIPMSSRLHLARLSVASAGDLSSALPPDESRWLELLLVFICVWITWPAIMDDISSRPTLHWSSHSNKSSQARHPESYLQQEQFQSGAKEFFIIVAKFVYPNTSWTLFDNTLRHQSQNFILL